MNMHSLMVLYTLGTVQCTHSASQEYVANVDNTTFSRKNCTFLIKLMYS